MTTPNRMIVDRTKKQEMHYHTKYDQLKEQYADIRRRLDRSVVEQSTVNMEVRHNVLPR